MSHGVLFLQSNEPKTRYRIYTDKHIAYFECIRGLLPGFGMAVTKSTLKKLIQNNVTEAILTLNKSQHELYLERTETKKIVELLNSQMMETVELKKEVLLTIGEVSTMLNVPATAIRHWERAGIIMPIRNPENQYRLFTSKHIRQISFLRALKKSVFSLDTIRAIIAELENDNYEMVKKADDDALLHFDKLCKYQLMGMHAFFNLCVSIGVFQANEFLAYSIYSP